MTELARSWQNHETIEVAALSDSFDGLCDVFYSNLSTEFCSIFTETRQVQRTVAISNLTEIFYIFSRNNFTLQIFLYLLLGEDQPLSY